MATLNERLDLKFTDFAVILSGLHMYKKSMQDDLNSLHRTLGEDDYKSDPVANYGEDKLHIATTLYEKIHLELYGEPNVDDRLLDCEECGKTGPGEQLSANGLCPICVKAWIG